MYFEMANSWNIHKTIDPDPASQFQFLSFDLIVASQPPFSKYYMAMFLMRSLLWYIGFIISGVYYIVS